jgi:hypothetical protein
MTTPVSSGSRVHPKGVCTLPDGLEGPNYPIPDKPTRREFP